MREKSFQLIKYSCTRPDSYRDVPAAETKSIGLQADSRVVMVEILKILNRYQIEVLSWQKSMCLVQYLTHNGPAV